MMIDRKEAFRENLISVFNQEILFFASRDWQSEEWSNIYGDIFGAKMFTYRIAWGRSRTFGTLTPSGPNHRSRQEISTLLLHSQKRVLNKIARLDKLRPTPSQKSRIMTSPASTYVLRNPQTGYTLLEVTGKELEFSNKYQTLFETYGYRIPPNCRTGDFENRDYVRLEDKDFFDAISKFFIPEKLERGFEYVLKPRPPIATKSCPTKAPLSRQDFTTPQFPISGRGRFDYLGEHLH